ncbi:MAG: single-stranded DNA-binding protein [Eubacterium sp.]|nr:single-stranded DNA-binding protein [Eubacterium sp.]
MNKVILMGNLTRDPEISYSQSSNLAIARFSIAVNRRFAREGETDVDFFNCTAFGKTAEFVEKYFHKGSRMLLSGRVENDNYTNKNGEKVYSVRILAEDVEFAERKSAAESFTGGGGGNYGGQGGGDNPMPAPPQPGNASDADFMDIEKGVQDDIPFFNQ